MNEGYIKLNNAIWRQAVIDETQEQKTRLLCETTELTFNALKKYDKDKRNTFAKVSKIITIEYGSASVTILKQLEMEFEREILNLEKHIKNKIARESQQWPNNVRKDNLYEKESTKVRDNILRTFVAKEA